MIKTRFAPSPTGKLHVGNVRTALFAYLYAKHHNGHFILRIEDTDKERSRPEYTKKLMEDLRWLGMDWDEGPEVGGSNGPYFQSERQAIYEKYAQMLIDSGHAYHCYCTPEEVEARKKEAVAKGDAPIYDGHCRHLTRSQKEAYEAEGRKPVVRFLTYDENFSFKDIVKDEVTFPKGMVGDFVIMRSSGIPVYNFAVVLDDALMEVTHVLRADEHLSNTLRQLMIFKALNLKVPQFAHMSLVLGKDRQKLSKRHGATSVSEFREMGYLPEALDNYLSLLGWSSPDGREIIPMEELKTLFELDRLSTSPAIFDQKKFDWLAKHYIINEPFEKIYEQALPFILKNGLIDETWLSDDENVKFLKGVVQLTRSYCSKLSDIVGHIDYFLRDEYPFSKDATKFLARESSKTVIESFKTLLEAEDREISEQIFGSMINKIKEDTGIKGKNLFMPLRAALTGRTQGPETYFLIPVIGKERTIKRLERVLAADFSKEIG